LESGLAPIEEEVKEFEQTAQANLPGVVSNLELDRNLSCNEMDSDDLDGDLNLSDEDEGARAQVRQQNQNVLQQQPQVAQTVAPREKYAVEFDTNVFRVSLDCLQNKGQLVTGDAELCKQCNGVFNQTSQLADEGGKQIWTCEFCNHKNEVVIDPEEIPQSTEVTYLLEAAAQIEQAEEVKNEGVSDKISVVFCIDISGSMD